MKKIMNKYGFGLLAGAFILLMVSCTSNSTDAQMKHNDNQVRGVIAPASLQSKALEFEINKTELVSGTEQRLFRDGTFTSYFFADRMFSDGRDYNGFSWGSEYQYSTTSNKSDIVQLIKIPDNGATIEINVKTQLTYLTPDSGTFELDINQHHSVAGSVHYRHAGTFRNVNKQLEMMEEGLTHSNLNFVFQDVFAKDKNITISPGSKITMNFPDAKIGKFILNNKNYETNDYQIIPVDTFTKKIVGKLNGDTPFEILLHYDRFYFGQFEVNVGNDVLRAKGIFTNSRWIPAGDYKIQGKFTDGLKYLSKHTKIEYPYSVYLPPNYKNSTKKFPVLYLTDGQWVKEFHKIVEAHHKEFIVVAIEQGPENRRWDDFKLPGALAYSRFLKEEIIPHIEKRYRTNTHRIFWGTSLGGSLGEILLSQETTAKPYFSVYALADGAFWANPPEVREKLQAALSPSKAERISIFTSGTRQGNYLVNLEFVNRLQALDNTLLDIRNIELKKTHDEMSTPTFEHYIDALQ